MISLSQAPEMLHLLSDSGRIRNLLDRDDTHFAFQWFADRDCQSRMDRSSICTSQADGLRIERFGHHTWLPELLHRYVSLDTLDGRALSDVAQMYATLLKGVLYLQACYSWPTTYKA